MAKGVYQLTLEDVGWLFGCCLVVWLLLFGVVVWCCCLVLLLGSNIWMAAQAATPKVKGKGMRGCGTALNG